MTLKDKKKYSSLGNYYNEKDVKKAVLEVENWLNDEKEEFHNYTINISEVENKFRAIFGDFEK